MLDKIKNGVKDIPISADAFGFAAVMASVAPVPDAIGNLVTSIRYIALSHSVWSVLQPAIPVIILALAAIAFCKNNYKVALAAGIVATIYFLLPASHMSTEPVVIQLCDTICLALYTLKLCVQDNYEETGYRFDLQDGWQLEWAMRTATRIPCGA